jgi:hypothetical protein
MLAGCFIKLPFPHFYVNCKRKKNQKRKVIIVVAIYNTLESKSKGPLTGENVGGNKSLPAQGSGVCKLIFHQTLAGS